MLLDHFNLLDETFIRSRVPWSGKGIMTLQGHCEFDPSRSV